MINKVVGVEGVGWGSKIVIGPPAENGATLHFALKTVPGECTVETRRQAWFCRGTLSLVFTGHGARTIEHSFNALIFREPVVSQFGGNAKLYPEPVQLSWRVFLLPLGGEG
jgi:hypothetical protein